MKKLVSLLSLLLLSSIGVWAQHWSNPHINQSAGKTIIYADLTTNANTANLEIAAFIDGECRFAKSYANATRTGGDGKPYLYIEVPGGYDNTDDEGKPINFMAYDTSTGAEYVVTQVGGPDLNYGNQATYGTPPSNADSRIKLTLTVPTEVTMQTPFTVNVGETIDLNTLLTITPADAQVPLNAFYRVDGYEEYASVSGSYLTGLKITQQSCQVQLICPGANEPIASAYFQVKQPATAINIVTPELTVSKGDYTTLTRFMINSLTVDQEEVLAYELVPADATDWPRWEVDPEYISLDEGFNFTSAPIKGGTTKVRPYIERADGTKLYPSNPEWITINIVVPVESITLSNFTGTSSICNVGDDIYQWIASRVTILPEDATDKTFTITEINNNGENLFTITDGSVVANEEGQTRLRILANGGTENTVIYLDMNVVNQAKEIVFLKEKLSYTTNIESEVVKTDVENNISWSPAGSTPEGSLEFDGIFSQWYGSFDHGSLMLYGEEIQLTSSTNTVTLTLNWNDYSNYNGTSESIVKQSTTKSFQIVISEGLQGFNFTITPDEDPRSGTIELTPIPANAEFNWDDFYLELSWEEEFSDWYAHMDIGSINEGSCSYDAVLPGSYTVKAIQNGGGTISETTFEVPYVAEFAAGWQWRSNPYGDIDEDINTFYGVFGEDNVIEARTYDDQSYNDPSWGWWGSLNYISQSQMYKVNMTSAHKSTIYGGNIMKQNLQGTLKPGWNWIGCPYFYNRTLKYSSSDGYRFDVGQADGVVIVSKNSGSAEYIQGDFEGDLQYLEPGQGYLVYNPYDTDQYYTFFAEVGVMSQGNEGTNPNHAPAREGSRVWNYDHTRFVNNMTMVAEFDVLPNAEDWSLGAFVGDECRGEGRYVNGKFFITVHTNGGEQVSFKLYNTATGEYSDVDQTFKTKQRLGSLKEPVKLSSQAVVTGIEEIENGELTIDNSSEAIYNQNGVRQQQMRRGLNIVRMADGSVKKIVVK